jgi:hypothetical protein
MTAGLQPSWCNLIGKPLGIPPDSENYDHALADEKDLWKLPPETPSIVTAVTEPRREKKL